MRAVGERVGEGLRWILGVVEELHALHELTLALPPFSLTLQEVPMTGGEDRQARALW